MVNMSKIIFLDIDGVLATDKEFMMSRSKFWGKFKEAEEMKIPYPFNPKCVKILNEILIETDADIVLSSDWKYHWGIGGLDGVFKFNKVIKSPIDITIKEDVSMSWIEKNRAYQIGKYVQDFNLTNYVVIDDLNIKSFMEITGDSDKFVRTNDLEGIKEKGLKDKIINILNKTK
jgi:hypothetical protein